MIYHAFFCFCFLQALEAGSWEEHLRISDRDSRKGGFEFGEAGAKVEENQTTTNEHARPHSNFDF